MKKSPIEVWKNCLTIIKDNVNELGFDTWFKPIKPIRLENNVLTIQVPSQFFYEWLEEHYIDLLKLTICRELGDDARLEYSIIMDGTNLHTVHAETSNKQNTINQPTTVPLHLYNDTHKAIPDPFIIPGIKKIKINSQLNGNYSFDNFIEGDCNRLARAAGYAVAENPGKTAFNPLFLHGATGLGKTHLMQAIGIQTKQNHVDKTVLYVTADQFMNQFVEAARNKNVNDFTHFYQLIDVLLIDDIHKFAGENKAKTQDEFFHIFNYLHQNGKQIVLTSDKAPVELEGIEPRLLSRFKWGLATDLTIPDVETRMAILRKKNMINNVVMGDDVVEYIAYSISTNVRELEGTLTSLLAQSILNKKTITLDLAKQMVDKIVRNTVKEISIEYIQKIVCDYVGVPIEEINTKTRKREIVQARQLSMYFAKIYTKASLANIGLHCGNKDHATVLHAYKTVNNLIETDKQFKLCVDDIEKKLKM